MRSFGCAFFNIGGIVMDKRFAENLKKSRLEKDWTQQDIADMLHCDRTSYNKYENGKAYPFVGKLYALIDIFGVSADELLG